MGLPWRAPGGEALGDPRGTLVMLLAFSWPPPGSPGVLLASPGLLLAPPGLILDPPGLILASSWLLLALPGLLLATPGLTIPLGTIHKNRHVYTRLNTPATLDFTHVYTRLDTFFLDTVIFLDTHRFRFCA